MKFNKSVYYLAPIIQSKVDFSIYVGLINVYAFIAGAENISNNCILLEYTSSSPIVNLLKSLPCFEKEITTSNGIGLCFRLSEYEYKRIYIPFINGHYSKICKNYVTQHIHPYNPDGTSNQTWLVLWKDPIMKKYWEDRLDIDLGDAEVASKIKLEDEVLVLT